MSIQIFSHKLVKLDEYENVLIFSYGIKLSSEQMIELLPLCNAREFEPFRNRKMEMGEERYCGYRDKAQLSFRGITGSYIPMIEFPMMYFHDEGRESHTGNLRLWSAEDESTGRYCAKDSNANWHIRGAGTASRGKSPGTYP